MASSAAWSRLVRGRASGGRVGSSVGVGDGVSVMVALGVTLGVGLALAVAVGEAVKVAVKVAGRVARSSLVARLCSAGVMLATCPRASALGDEITDALTGELTKVGKALSAGVQLALTAIMTLKIIVERFILTSFISVLTLIIARD